MTAGGWPSIGALLAHARRQFAGREAVVDGGRRLDYRALTTNAARLASGLRASAIPDGARIAYLGDNSAECLAAYLGVPAAGLVLLPLNTRLAAPELRYILEDSGTAVLLAAPGYEERAVEAATGTGAAVLGLAASLGDLRIEAVLARGRDTLPARGEAAALGYMYYTSGTTGRPKGVMLSHANVLAGALAAASGMGLHGGHIWLHAGPMFHLADAFAIWALAWLGGRHVTMRFEAAAAIGLIEAERVTHTLIVPTGIDRLADAARGARTRLDGLTALLYGGAPMPRPILDKARAAFDCALVPTYGMTETSGVITTGYPGDASVAGESGYVGREAPLVDLALVGDDGAPVADGAVGEVVVTAPSVMMGYWERPDDTAAVLAGGMIRTGDLGRRHEGGGLVLVDRKKDMIISGGENVYSREVELVLESHPAVLEAAVVGAPHPTWGETVVAFVRLRPGASVDLETLQGFARPRIAGYKLPRALHVVDRLPLTGSGKIAKAALRARLAAGA